MNRNNRSNKSYIWHRSEDFLNTPIIDQLLHFFDTITPLPPPPLTFFQYPIFVLVEQPRDYLKFKVIKKSQFKKWTRKPEKSTKAFHGCCRKNQDGTNRIIEKGKRCLTPTSYPFWKRIEDIPIGIRTRSQEQKQKLSNRGQYNRYLRQNGGDNIKRWLEADDSDVYIMKESDTFFVVSPDMVDSDVNMKEITEILF